MKAVASLIAVLSLAAAAVCAQAQAPSPPAKWIEGRNYFRVLQPKPTSLPQGKVLVTEVFSYACPACNQFQPYMQKVVKNPPANAVVDFVPASFNPSEDWPMFQLAYVTAQALGIADRTHDAMFEAVWTTGELATLDPATQSLKSKMPTIEDAARFYQKRTGVPVEKFLAMSKSFGVDNQVRHDEELIVAYGVDRTPTVIVNGKYRANTESAGGHTLAEASNNLLELVSWLVAKESK